MGAYSEQRCTRKSLKKFTENKKRLEKKMLLMKFNDSNYTG